MTAWVGDSRAVAGVKEEGGGWRAEALSVDHSINDPAERARVLAAGANPNPNLNPNPNPNPVPSPNLDPNPNPTLLPLP